MSSRTKALLAILIAALLWSSSAAVPKLLFRMAPPFTVAFERFALASLIILPLMLHAKKPKKFVQTLLPLGIFNALNIIFYYWGLSLTTANTASILGPTTPLVVTVLSYFLIGESVSKKKFIGILIGLAGALCIVLAPFFYHGSFVVGNINGNLLLIGSNISWSLYILYSRKILSKGNFSPILSTSINFFSVMIATGIAAIIFGQPLISPASLEPSFIILMFYAVIGITLVTFFLFQWAVQHVSATTASLKEYVQLVGGVGINTFLLKESFGLNFLIGSILVATGVFIATREHLTKRAASEVFNQTD